MDVLELVPGRVDADLVHQQPPVRLAVEVAGDRVRGDVVPGP
ncbi:hypothetical protein [Pseudactinotalea terrae]|nr:hypothetical protein [Pseudactinotalea terrae]